MAIRLDRAVETDEIVAALGRYGLTQADIAQAVGVSARSVRNWANDTAARRKNEQRLQDLREIVLLLDDSLTARGVGQWLRARNRLLDGARPLAVLAEGEIDRVRQAAEAFADGAYV